MKSKVAIVKGNNRRENIFKALELIKNDLVIDKNEVLLKPNCLQSMFPLCCTHVDAIRGVLDFLKDKEIRSRLIAETCRGTGKHESFEMLNYTSLISEYGVTLFNPQFEDEWVDGYLLDKHHREVKVKLSKRIYDCKCRISVAVAKTHDTVIITGAWKNMMGALALEDKVKMHGCNSHSERVLISEVEILPQNLVRIAKLVPPHISVIDGFIGMEGEGPVRGTEKRLGIAIASTDFVSADAVCAKAMGFDPEDISYLHFGDELGLGNADLNKIEIIGDPLEEVITPFVPHSKYEIHKKWKEIIPSLL